MSRKVIILNDKQDAFAFSKVRFNCISGGWGCGKTLAGCLRQHRRALERPRRILIGRKHYTDLRDSTLHDFLELFGSKIHWQEKDYSVRYPNGSQLLFRHLDNLRSLTNINLDGFWIDQAEEVGEETFNFLRGRIRKSADATGDLTCNPEGHNWIWKFFANPKTKHPSALRWVSPTWDNRDNLPSSFLADLDTLPAMVRKRYVEASDEAFEGQVFDEFDDSLHILDPFEIPAEWFRFEGIDHGYTNPTSVHWYATDYDDNVFSYDEHYEAGKLIEYHAQAIRDRRRASVFGGENQKIQASYIDPSTRSENIEYKGQLTSILKLYHLFGINAIPAANAVAPGINLIKQFLTPDPKRIHPRTGKPGAPRLYFLANCVTQIEEFKNLAWKKLRPTQAAVKNQPEEPVKKNDHSVDDCKYVLLSRFGHPERKTTDAPKNIGELVKRDLEQIEERERAEQFDLFIN